MRSWFRHSDHGRSVEEDGAAGRERRAGAVAAAVEERGQAVLRGRVLQADGAGGVVVARVVLVDDAVVAAFGLHGRIVDDYLGLNERRARRVFGHRVVLDDEAVVGRIVPVPDAIARGGDSVLPVDRDDARGRVVGQGDVGV